MQILSDAEFSTLAEIHAADPGMPRQGILDHLLAGHPDIGLGVWLETIYGLLTVQPRLLQVCRRGWPWRRRTVLALTDAGIEALVCAIEDRAPQAGADV